MTAPTETSARVDLAHEPDFRLGELVIRPSACAARTGGRERRLEPRVMEVLVLLSRAANHTVTRDDLIASCWGGRFVSDDAITRAIGKVRALARGVEPAPFVLETVPKVGFRLVTPSREAAPAHGDTPAALPARRRWSPARVTLLVLFLMLAALTSGWVAWRYSGRTDFAKGPTGSEWIDVAGFEPLQGDASLKRLARLSNDAMTRALAANGVDPAPGRAGAGSSARLLLKGTVDREGDRYMINVRMEDRGSGAVLWSRRFERPIGDVAGFQETIASHISDVLQCGQTRVRAYRGHMPDRLLAMFLNACSAARDETDRARYVELTRRIVEEAPRLSTAHSMHAAAAVMLAAMGLHTPKQTAALREQARASANRALALDPRNGEAFAALAGSAPPGDWRAQETYLRRALELGWAPANNWYIWLLLEVGRVQEATLLAGRTAATDPFSINALERLAWLQAVTGDLPTARQNLSRLELLDPAAGLEARLRIAFWHEDPSHAIVEYQQAEGRWPKQHIECARAYLADGWIGGGAGHAGLPTACEPQQASWKIRMLARSGQIEAAYRATSVDFTELQESTIFLFYPEMRRFRHDPRFMPLANRFGLVDYWLQTNLWPDFCDEPDLPYDCRAAARAAKRGAHDPR